MVSLLFNLVGADVAVFGEKDAQQLAVIRQMVRDLHIPVEIVPGPTVREEDGLAMSSRNAYLSADERRAATVLYRSLQAAAEAVRGGERRAGAVRDLMWRILSAEPLARIDYAEVVDETTFQPVEAIQGRLILPLAVKIGGTRLIDNIRLSAEER